MLLFIKIKALFLLLAALSSSLHDTEALSENNVADDKEKFHVEAVTKEIRYDHDDNGEEGIQLKRETIDEQREFPDKRALISGAKVSGFHRVLSRNVFFDRKLTTMDESSGKNSATTKHHRNIISPTKEPLVQSTAPTPSKNPPTTSPMTPRTTKPFLSSSTTSISSPPMPPSTPPTSTPTARQQFIPNCPSLLSCRGRCKDNQHRNPNQNAEYSCYCDDACEMFQDCCADLDMFCPLPNNSTSVRSNLAYYHCHSDIWMIDRCPRNWTNKEVHAKCITVFTSITMDNYFDFIPVVSRSGKTYRNRFCAQCHGENGDDIEHYGLDFDCELSPPQAYSLREAIEFLFDYCTRIQWRPKQGQPKRKCIQMKDSCPFDVDDFEDILKCITSPPKVVYQKLSNEKYKNAYCARCSMTSNQFSFLACGPMVIKPPDRPPAPFSIIMDIGGIEMDSKYIKNQAIRVTCPEINEVYDILLELCRPVFLRPAITTSSQFDKYRIALWIKSKLLLSVYGNNVVVKFLKISLDLDNKPHIHIVGWQHVKGQNIEILIFEMQLWKKLRPLRARRGNQQITIESILNFTKPVRFVFQNDSVIIIKATSILLTCVNVQYFTPKDYVVVHGSSSIYINQTQELLTEKQYFANSTKKHNGYHIPVGSIAVCRQHLPSTLTCNGTYISLDKDEYVMLPNNSVYRNVANTVYNQGEYSIINGSVIVCTKYSKKYTKTQLTDESQNDTALHILTSIGLSLSVVCLVFVLVTYLLFGELRTLPGINLINLSSALLVAHFVWLIGSGQTGSHGACVAIAVILHYSFLASFAWMSIIAFSTWKIFSSMRNANKSSKNESRKRKIRRTLAVGWLPVFVLVLICLILDQSGAVEIRYGGPKGCWVNNGRANLFIFVLPIAVSVVWNAVFFGLTVKALRKVAQQTRMVKEQRDYNPVYVKIAMLMGFTWIFGFLASFVSPYFLYPFVALNTIQGVYIAVCFTFTRRVKILYEALISGSKEKARNPKPQGLQAHGKTQTESTRL